VTPDAKTARIEDATRAARIASLVVISAMLGLLLLQAVSASGSSRVASPTAGSGISAAVLSLARSI
jgi:hypothetical protein